MSKTIKIQIDSDHYPAPDPNYIEREILGALDDPKSYPHVKLHAGDFTIESPFFPTPVTGVFWQKSIWVDGKEVRTDEFDRYELLVHDLPPSSTSEAYETDDHTITISWE